MSIELSKFGEALSAHTGIGQLMQDLGEALAGDQKMLMMGGGNPAHIPEIQAIWRERMRALATEGDTCDQMLGNYDPPRGNPRFIESLVSCLRQAYGWVLGPKNITVTNGGQTAFFYLINMLAGEFASGVRKKVLFPLMPEYIGYADQGVGDLFVTCKPRIEIIGDHAFKYHIDFDNLPLDEDIGAVCVSRPNNPSGNVLTDEEISRLSELARERNIPLIVDNAYGAPFPNVIFTETNPFWDENTILTFSLSKLGLPGTRTGIVLAREEVATAVASINAVVGLASGNIGQALVQPLLESGEILKLSRDVVCPYYRAKSDRAMAWVEEFIPGDIEYRVHVREGAFFLWMWFQDLPVAASELYERLKQRGVLVVPGSYFFYGLKEDWTHRDECIRLTYSQSDDTVREGIRILAEEVQKAYAAPTS